MRLVFCLTLCAPLALSGCLTSKAYRAFNDSGAIRPAAQQPTGRQPNPTLLAATRSPDGVYHVEVDWSDGERLRYSYDPGHPALAVGRRERWPSASTFYRPQRRGYPTCALRAAPLPNGVPVSVVDGRADASDLEGPAVQLRYATLYLREGAAFEKLAMLPPRAAVVQRKSRVHVRGVTGPLGKLVVLPLTVLVDVALFPISFPAWLLSG